MDSEDTDCSEQLLSCYNSCASRMTNGKNKKAILSPNSKTAAGSDSSESGAGGRQETRNKYPPHRQREGN